MAVRGGEGPVERDSPAVHQARPLHSTLAAADQGPPTPGALVMHPSIEMASSDSPTIRSYASKKVILSRSTTPNAIHSSHQLRIVVAEQLLSAIDSYAHPNRNTCNNFSKTRRSGHPRPAATQRIDNRPYGQQRGEPVPQRGHQP